MALELTIKEIAALLALKDRGVYEKAVRQNWEYDERQTGPGKPTRFYPFHSLPEKIQTEIIENCGDELFSRINTFVSGKLSNQAHAAITKRLRSKYEAEKARALEDRLDLNSGRRTLAQKAEENGISEKKLELALNRANLTALYYKELDATQWRERSKTSSHFIESYNSGALLPDIYTVVGGVSTRTLERWKKALKDNNNNYLALVPGWGKNKGKTSLTSLEMETLVNAVLSPQAPEVNQAIRKAIKKIKLAGIEPKHPRTYQRFLKRYRETNMDGWLAAREGGLIMKTKALFDLERDYDKIEVGDILVADGHTLNFTTLDHETGKPKRMTLILFYDMRSNYPVGWEVMPTENVQAIAAALRRAIIRLGKTPKIVYLDNGKAFRAKYFTGTKDFKQTHLPGLFQSLGISTIFARPYNAQSKTVERFFRIFAELEKSAPSYVGTSIAKKPAYLKQGEKKIRKLYEEHVGGAVPTMEETHLAIATWFDEYGSREVTKGHMKGQKPIKVFEAGRGPGVDPVKLRYWMMKQKPQMIDKNGVRFLGRNYWHPDLFGRKHLAVIRYDFHDTRSVLVYDTDGKLICEAMRKIKVHPAAEIMGTEEDKEEFKKQIALQRSLEAKTVNSCLDLYKNHVLPQHQSNIIDLGFSDRKGTEIPGEFIEETLESKPLTAEEKERSAAYLDKKDEPTQTPPGRVIDELDELRELRYYAENPQEITNDIQERIDYLLSRSPTYAMVWETLHQKTG